LVLISKSNYEANHTFSFCCHIKPPVHKQHSYPSNGNASLDWIIKGNLQILKETSGGKSNVEIVCLHPLRSLGREYNPTLQVCMITSTMGAQFRDVWNSTVCIFLAFDI
jgi:hypothetical protein